jgi:hypothetical protein
MLVGQQTVLVIAFKLVYFLTIEDTADEFELTVGELHGRDIFHT